jgi:hypothetical protein
LMTPHKMLLSGPCGVGKTSIAALLETRFSGLRHLDVDRLSVLPDGMSFAPGCASSSFNLEDCLSAHLAASPSGFVIDIGGDTMFREGADNDQRLRQVLEFKQRHGVRVVLLTSQEAVLRSRFVACKSRLPDEFDAPWRDWVETAEPYWRRCADCVVDAGAFDLADSAQRDALIGQVLD